LKERLNDISLFCYKNALWFVLLLVAILVAELYYLKDNFGVNTDLRALFKGSNETVVKLEKMEARVGSYSNILVLASSADRIRNIEFLTKLEEEIKGDSRIRFIDFDRDVSYLEERGILFLPLEELEEIESEVKKNLAGGVENALSFGFGEDEKEKDEKESVPKLTDEDFDKFSRKVEEYKKKYNVRRYFETEGGAIVAMKVRPSGSDTSVSQTKELVDYLEKKVGELNPAAYGLEVEVGGFFRNKIKEMESIYNDIFSTLALCVILLSITIIYYFRSLRSLFVIFFPLSAGVITAATVMQYFLGDFNIISAFSFAILYGLGIDSGIHLLSRYGEEKEKGLPPYLAMASCYRNLISAVFSGALTTAIAFFSLYFIQFKGFSDFGLAAAIGVVTSFIAITVFFPAFVFFNEKIVPLKIRTRKITILPVIYSFLSKKPAILVGSLILLTASSLIAFYYVEVEYNFDKLSFPNKYDPDSLSMRYVKGIKKNKTDEISTGLPSYILTDSIEETEDVSETLKKIKKEQPFSIRFKDFFSVFSFIPSEQQEKLRVVRRIRRMINNKINLFDEDVIIRYREELEPILSVDSEIEIDLMPEWIVDGLAEKDGTSGRFIILALAGNKSDVKDVLRIKEEYGTIKGELKDYEMLGSYMLLGDMKDVIEKHVPLAILFAFMAVLFVMMFLYKSLKKSLVVIMPLAAGISWMILVSFVSGLKMNIFNMVVIPTVVGIGIDSAIHIYHRYKNEGSDNMDTTLKNTGGAVLFSSLTTFVGFASIAFAHHRGLNSIGIVASIGIVTVTIANLIFFPAFLKFFEVKKPTDN
jgi:uncharacterized protein